MNLHRYTASHLKSSQPICLCKCREFAGMQSRTVDDMTESTQRGPISIPVSRLHSLKTIPKIMIDRPAVSPRVFRRETWKWDAREDFFLRAQMRRKKYAVIEAKLETFVTPEFFKNASSFPEKTLSPRFLRASATFSFREFWDFRVFLTSLSFPLCPSLSLSFPLYRTGKHTNRYYANKVRRGKLRTLFERLKVGGEISASSFYFVMGGQLPWPFERRCCYRNN